MTDYPNAGGPNAQPEVREAVRRFRSLPIVEQNRIPLLYWLLGSATPPYKMEPAEANYSRTATGAEKCSNCRHAWQNVPGGFYICAMIRGRIEPGAWCRLWEAPY